MFNIKKYLIRKSTEDHALSSDSCFNNDMENNDEVIYRDLNRTQVNPALNSVKKMCCTSTTLKVMEDIAQYAL